MIITTVSFMSVTDLAKYLITHKNKEIGFTSDTITDILVDGIYPSEWYGLAITDMFDADAIVFGYYGAGINSHYDVDTVEDIVVSIIDYFKIEFGMKIDEEYMMCIFREDLED